MPHSSHRAFARKRALLLLAKLVFSGLLVWAVLHKIDVGSIFARLRGADILWVLPALLLGPVAIVLSAWRWKLLSLGLLRLSEAVRYTWIGLFFGSILPGVIGGDVAKGVSLAAKENRTRDSRLSVSIIVDKLVGFWALLMLFDLIALGLMATQPTLLPNLRGSLWLTLAASAAGLATGVAICHPRGAIQVGNLVGILPFAFLRGAASRVLSAIASYRGKAALLASTAAISMVLHGLNAVSFWLVLHALAIPASLWFAAVFYSLLSVLLALPVSISGVGVREVFAASIFTGFGMNPEAGVAFSWVLLGLSIPNALVGATIQCWEIFRRSRTR